MTRVVNLYREAYDVYIGRPGKGMAGPWGNPFPVPRGASPDASLIQYEQYLRNKVATDPQFRKDLLALQGKVLGCFCKPKPCHGDIMIQVINELLESGH